MTKYLIEWSKENSSLDGGIESIRTTLANTLKVGDGQSGEGGDVAVNAGSTSSATSGGSIRFTTGKFYFDATKEK